MRVILFVCALMFFMIGCSENAGVNISKEHTLDGIISSFETLVWEMHDNDGITENRVSEILGMELRQDPSFIAVYIAETGIEGVELAVSWKRENNELFSNASLVIKTDTLNEPLPVDISDLLPYRDVIKPGTKLDYFEALFERPGILTDYMMDIFKYRWWSDDFIVIVEVDKNLEVKWLDVEFISGINETGA